MHNTYDIGDQVVLRAAFTDDVGDPFDPTGSVKFGVRTPDGIETFYVYGTDVEVIKDSTGNYHMFVYPVADKKHSYRAVGVGNTADDTVLFAAAEKFFTVRTSAFTAPLGP